MPGADREPPPARAALSRRAACLRLPPPPFPWNLSPARLHPGASLGGEAAGRFLASLLPRSRGSQPPRFSSWTGSHPLLSPSFSSGSLPFPVVPAPQSLSQPRSQHPLFLFLAWGATHPLPSSALGAVRSPPSVSLAWRRRPCGLLLWSFLGPCPSCSAWSSRSRTQPPSTPRGLLPHKKTSLKHELSLETTPASLPTC